MRHDVPTVIAGPETSPVCGQVKWSPVKSIWWFAMTTGALAAPTFYWSWAGLVLFLLCSAITLCLGHSLGMHRRLIHRSYECPLWMERLFVYLGTLVGMAGPVGMVRTHDFRDWAQRQAQCHDYFAHRSSFFHDAWWQLHCELELSRPPRFEIPEALQHDRFLMWVERTWMAQQLPWALLLYALGGTGWVLWGVCLRVSVSLTGHWLVGHFAHRSGPQHWHVDGAAVQGHNVAGCGLITFGECWHNNHHAFPGSAKLGLYPGQPDPGWWVLQTLKAARLVWNISLPGSFPLRKELRAVIENHRNTGGTC
jgi:fatty-acid desaturase